ncbi:MAG TPA: hypothetical protein PLH18_06745 [Clostridia bacterium]|nr:hypothetical protein [Clostridia bacterium]
MDKPKLPSRNIRDVFKRGIKIMQLMQTEGYYKNSVDYVRNDVNFMDLSDDKLMETRDRIAKWIGQPIDTRWMVGSAMNPLSKDSALDAKEVIMLHKVHKMCWFIHDVLWIAWSAIGEYKKGDRLDWAKGLILTSTVFSDSKNVENKKD